MDNPNSVQFGGDHYIRAGHAQHWDLLPAIGYGWEYYTGRATAYLTRIKDPTIDPSKAGHFLDKLIWLIDKDLVPGTFVVTRPTDFDLDKYLKNVYFPANAVIPGSLEAKGIRAILSARTREHLVAARELVSALEAGLSPPEPDMFEGKNDPATLKHDPSNASELGWPFAAAATAAYVNQDRAEPAPPKFSTGGGGDFAGAGTEAKWEEEKPATVEAERDNRTFVFGDSAIAASSQADSDESCRASSYASPSPSDSSSSSSDSSSSDSGGSSGSSSND